MIFEFFFITFTTIRCFAFDCNSDTERERDWRPLQDLQSAEHYSSFCNIDKVDIAELSSAQFDLQFRERAPVIIVDRNRQAPYLPLLSRRNLLQTHGDLPVKLSSSNTYSYDKLHAKFSEYVLSHVTRSINKHSLANETFYLFGNDVVQFFCMIFNF